jgi:hypothetical protein
MGWIVFVLLSACQHGMGEPCNKSSACADPGLCLSGVCTGYPCNTSADCENGLQCATVNDVQGCFQPCTSTSDCGGDQVCLEVPTSTADEAATAPYCL